MLGEKTSIDTIVLSRDRRSCGCPLVHRLIQVLKTVSKVYVDDCSIRHRHFNKAFGINGYEVNGEMDDLKDVWCWEAEKGKVLTWQD